MLHIAQRVNARLLMNSRACFANDVNFFNSTNPVVERVMSTPTWPVPYYQRLNKAYPIREEKKVDISPHQQANDRNWLNAKYKMKQTLKGRQIVEYTENELPLNTYLIKKNDCESMANAYVDDVSQFLNLANNENIRILAGKTLI